VGPERGSGKQLLHRLNRFGWLLGITTAAEQVYGFRFRQQGITHSAKGADS